MRSLAPMELLGMGRVWVAWTDVGGVGVVRRPFLTKIAKFCQGLVHLRLEHVTGTPRPWRRRESVVYYLPL